MALTLGLASVVHSIVTWVLTGAPISWLGMYIIGWTANEQSILIMMRQLEMFTFDN